MAIRSRLITLENQVEGTALKINLPQMVPSTNMGTKITVRAIVWSVPAPFAINPPSKNHIATATVMIIFARWTFGLELEDI